MQDIEPGGIVVERAPVEPAADGGISGFPLELTPSATVWDAFSGCPDCANDTTDFLEQLDAEPRGLRLRRKGSIPSWLLAVVLVIKINRLSFPALR